MSGPAPPPEAYARWTAAAAGGPAQILVTARASAAIVSAEALGPRGERAAAEPGPVRSGGRDYGVAIAGSSDTGLSLGLSLDTIARALGPPQRRRFAAIPLPPGLAEEYRRSWRDWQVVVRFQDGPVLALPPPEPRE